MKVSHSVKMYIASNRKQFQFYLLICSVSVQLVGAICILLKSSQRSFSAARTIKRMLKKLCDDHCSYSRNSDLLYVSVLRIEIHKFSGIVCN